MKRSSLTYPLASIKMSSLHFWNLKKQRKSIYRVSQIQEECKTTSFGICLLCFPFVDFRVGCDHGLGRGDGKIYLAADAMSMALLGCVLVVLSHPP